MKRKLLAIVVILGMLLSVMTLPAHAAVYSRTYTTDADFDEGTLVGVEHTTVHDQLQLTKTPVTLPFIWVPNNDGTVSKVNTETGAELGRYYVAPPNLGTNPSPSRTTVDQQGSCYVGNRQAGTVVKIGLVLAGNWIDRNGNGVPDTSRDANNDGNIDTSEMLPWGQDECVLYELVLVPGHEGAYTPGTYTGPYDTNYWGVAPRGLAIDKNNNLWAGTWSTSKFYYIRGDNGTILKTVDVSSYPHNSYGAVIDKNGVLWSAGPNHTGSQTNNILRLDPSTEPPTISRLNMSYVVYGLGLDYLGHLLVSGWCSDVFSKIDVSTGIIEWTKGTGQSCSRGVVATSDNNIWIANSSSNTVTRYDNDGNLLATISGFNQPSGVAVDAAGKVWACNIGDPNVKRIVPASNTVDLTKNVVGSGGHYTYSDMTGILSRTITTKIGTWTVIFDSGMANMPWGKVSWNSQEPPGTSVTVQVRSSNSSGGPWSGWENATNGVPLTSTPDGQYLQIETTLKITQGEVSPILYDLTVEVKNRPPDCSKAYADPGCLWPPDHKFVDIAIKGVTDPDGDPVTITITGITSDEPTATDKGSGGATNSPDAKGVGTSTASVRAERSGDGDGRVYVISFKASDGKGGECIGSVVVKVPRDQSDKTCQAVDSGQKYDATQKN